MPDSNAFASNANGNNLSPSSGSIPSVSTAGIKPSIPGPETSATREEPLDPHAAPVDASGANAAHYLPNDDRSTAAAAAASADNQTLPGIHAPLEHDDARQHAQLAESQRINGIAANKLSTTTESIPSDIHASPSAPVEPPSVSVPPAPESQGECTVVCLSSAAL